MAVLDPNEIFFTAFEPKQSNRFILYMDGIPSFMIKKTAAVTLTQGVVTLDHINVERKVKGKSKWGDVALSSQRNQDTLLQPDGLACLGSV